MRNRLQLCLTFSLLVLAVSNLSAAKNLAIRLPAAAKDITSFTIYDTDKIEAMASATNAEFDLSVLQEILPRAKYTAGNVNLKDRIVGRISMHDGSKLIVFISYYGRFFAPENTPGFYIFSKDDGEKWNQECTRILKIFQTARAKIQAG